MPSSKTTVSFLQGTWWYELSYRRRLVAKYHRKCEQRAWLKQRKQTCHSKTLPKASEAFLTAVANDPKITQCIVKQSKARLEQRRAERVAIFDAHCRPMPHRRILSKIAQSSGKRIN